MIITKQVEVIVNSKTLNYYKNKGYNCNKVGEILNVKIEDLPKYSRYKILVQCDYCGKTVEKSYNDWAKGQEFIQKDSCKHCSFKKTSEINKLLYGYENAFQIPTVKEKIKLKIQETYGGEIENISQSKEIQIKKKRNLEEKLEKNPNYYNEIQNKVKATSLEKYGVEYKQKTLEFQEKKKATCKEKYGFEFASQSPQVKEKVKQTFQNNYGFDNCSQNPFIKNKVLKTRFKQNNFICSKTQKKLQEIIGGELNYPCEVFAIDICFPEEKIAIEYNGSGHNLSVKRGYVSEEQFLHKEKYREKILFDNDYKIIYFNSMTDILPENKIIQDLFNYSLFLIKNFNKHRIIIDLDEKILYSSIGEIKFESIIKTMND